MTEKELSCTSCDSDFDTIKWFEPISLGIKSKDESELMFMPKEGELWDWGLNEKVKIPTKNSNCFEISLFILFIKTRKF